MNNDYRKKVFRGAKIEDCILLFEKNEKQAKAQKEDTKDKGEKRFFEGLALAYKFASQTLRWEFDYKKDEWEKRIILKIENIIKQLELFESNSRIIPVNLDLVKKHSMSEDLQKGIYKGMAHGYSTIVNRLKNELINRKGKESVGNIVSDCIQEFEYITKNYRKESDEAEDDFIKGFFGGINLAYNNALKQLKVEI
ncbi:MAG: hypothetical protein ABF868_11760 [Sporolactobacillus sp.]